MIWFGYGETWTESLIKKSTAPLSWTLHCLGHRTDRKTNSDARTQTQKIPLDLSDLLLTCHPLHRLFPIPLFFKRFPLPSFRLPFPFLPNNNCRNTHEHHLSLPSLIFIIITVYFWGPDIWGLLSGKSGIRARSRVRYSRRVEISKEISVGLNSKTQSSVGTLGFLRRLFICFCFSFSSSFRRHKRDLSLSDI